MEVYAGTIRLAVEIGGVDLILIETMTDCYETKAAVLAAKENCSLPVFVTNAYDASGKLMTGATPAAMVAMLEGLGVDALGCNCSCGPDLMIPVVKELAAHASVPVIANPNAGLPETDADGNLFYTVTPEQFADEMREMVIAGATVIGGCCGTTPDYLEATVRATHDMVYRLPQAKRETVVSSGTHTVTFGNSPVLIGERITRRAKRGSGALLDGDYDLILSEGVRQADAGAMMLDVNAGLPGIDEAEAVSTIVRRLQAVCDLPLQIDTTDAKAMERAMRICNGKPLVNSVNGSRESMEKIFPLVKKYGGCVIALTMDENGIPETAEGRFEIARRIAETAAEYGIPKHDIIADPLTLTVSSGDENAKITLGRGCTHQGKTRHLYKPRRFQCFLRASRPGGGERCLLPDGAFPRTGCRNHESVFRGNDAGLSSLPDARGEGFPLLWIPFVCRGTIPRQLPQVRQPPRREIPPPLPSVRWGPFPGAIERGLSDTARSLTLALLENTEPLEIIEHEIVPALNRVGVAFEKKQAYLPQLLMAADAASAAFAVIKEKMPSAADPDKRIVIATVRGDLHDIGKNIVRVLLENFGFYVEDLGRDVPPETVAEAAKGCRLVGLSALMTTTVPAMEETIRLVHEVSPGTRVMVGGAVLTEEYAARIGADFYAADAMGAVRIAETVFGK